MEEQDVRINQECEAEEWPSRGTLTSMILRGPSGTRIEMGVEGMSRWQRYRSVSLGYDHNWKMVG